MKRDRRIPEIGEIICPARGEPVPYILSDGGVKQCISSAVCGDRCEDKQKRTDSKGRQKS
ncbi:MAG: hypothetical protein LUH54_04665 [Firmicutes bacterium]|nr:hypothetical protein [Bacillota bacterium]